MASAPSHTPRRTLDQVVSFSQQDFEACNRVASTGWMERACPKEMRAPPLLIGVAGGTASGKTTVCRTIAEKMDDERVVIISMDNFYRPLTPDERANVDEYNFDHPHAFDISEITRCLDSLKKGKETVIPEYDFATHSRSDTVYKVKPCEVIMFEGILVLHIPEVVERLNMKIYVDTDDDLRLSRRILRDIEQRGRDLKGVIAQYTRDVKPAQDKFVTPSRRVADVIIPWHDRNNEMAIELVTKHLKVKLEQHPLVRQYPNLHAMVQTPILKQMHTVIRDQNTERQDFVFYADRLIRLVVEAGLGFLPFGEKCVQTPEGYQYVGVDFARKLCGVSVIRSGEAMESALRDCCLGIKIGKILVQRKNFVEEFSALNDTQAVPELSSKLHDTEKRPLLQSASSAMMDRLPSHPQPVDDVDANLQSTSVQHDEHPLVYYKLPDDIADRHVLVLDPILSSGYTVVRAIETLLSKGCSEDKVYVLCLIAAPQGIHAVCKRYPLIRVICSEIDTGLDEHSFVVPGIGEFGDRYFSK